MTVDMLRSQGRRVAQDSLEAIASLQAECMQLHWHVRRAWADFHPPQAVRTCRKTNEIKKGENLC